MLLNGKVWHNGRAAHQLYEERFQHRQTPSHALFAKVYQRALETGTFTVSRSDCGAPWQRHIPELEDAVFHEVEEDVTSSV